MNFFITHIELLLVLLIVFQALIFAVLFIRTKKDDPGRVLFYYELVYLANYVLIFLFLNKKYALFVHVYPLVISFYALFPVLFYLFIKKIIYRRIDKEWIHFVFPGVLLVINLVFFLWLNYNERYAIIVQNSLEGNASSGGEIFLLMHTIVYPLLLKIQPFVYIVFVVKDIKVHKKCLQNEYSDLEKIGLNWATRIMVIFAFFFIISFFTGQNITYDLSFILLVNILIGFEAVQYRYTYVSASSPLTAVAKQGCSHKYESSGLNDKEKSRIDVLLKQYMQANKPFLEPDITLTSIAKELDSNRQYLSQVINEKYNMNFYSFINEYRIKEFIDLLKDGQTKNYSIEGVYGMVGFRSKASFYNAFRKVEKCTPKQYKNRLNKS